MIVIADVHLGKVSDSIKTEQGFSQIEDIRIRLQEVLDVAKRDKETIVVAGDIFNTVNPPTWVITVWFEFLTACRNVGVNVVTFPGNHDAGVSWVNLAMIEKADLDNVLVVVDPGVVEIEGHEVGILPHIPLKQRDVILSEFGSIGAFYNTNFPDVDFIIGHGQIRGIQYSNDIFFEAGDALDINFQDFPNCELMVLGHIHAHTVYDRVVYPGSLTCTNFGEVDDVKGYLKVDVDTLEWEFHEFVSEVTPYRDVVIDLVTKDTVTLDDDVIRDIAEGAVVKITVNTTDLMKVNEYEIRKAFNKWGYVSRFETVKVDSQHKEYSPDLSKDSVTMLSPIDALAEYVTTLDITLKERKAVLKYGKEIIEGVTHAI